MNHGVNYPGVQSCWLSFVQLQSNIVCKVTLKSNDSFYLSVLKKMFKSRDERCLLQNNAKSFETLNVDGSYSGTIAVLTETPWQAALAGRIKPI